jgi:hypothetical protein
MLEVDDAITAVARFGAQKSATKLAVDIAVGRAVVARLLAGDHPIAAIGAIGALAGTPAICAVAVVWCLAGIAAVVAFLAWFHDAVATHGGQPAVRASPRVFPAHICARPSRHPTSPTGLDLLAVTGAAVTTHRIAIVAGFTGG